MVIYADVLFLVNFISDYMALIILGKFMKLRIRQWRVIAGSAVGAAGTVLIFCANAQHLFFKIFLAFVMILCAYGFHGKQTASVYAAFLLVMASVSGAVTLMVSVIPIGVNSVIKNGVVYFDISGALLLAILLIAYPSVWIISKGIRSRKNRSVYQARIERSGKNVTVNALFDSGNQLREPITKRPVVVAEWSAVRTLFDESVGFEELLDKAEEYRLWLIPYRALGSSDGRIFAFLADRIQIEKQVTERVFIGVTGEIISKEYQALLNADLI